MMKLSDAIELLGLSSSFSETELDASYETTREKLTSRLESAPDALKPKFANNLTQLDEAKALLQRHLANDIEVESEDLPMSEAFVKESHDDPIIAQIKSRFDSVERVSKNKQYQILNGKMAETGELVTIKLYERQLSKSEQDKVDQRMLFLSSLHSHFVEEIIDYSVEENGVWYATKNYQVEPVLRFFEDKSRTEIFNWVKQAAKELEYAFGDQSHFNISLETLSVSNQSEPLFSDSWLESLTKTDKANSHYRAPESKRSGLGNKRSDSYSLSVILLELLLARRLSDASLQDALKDGALPGKAQACFQKALNNNPTRRYASIEEFVSDLEAAYESPIKKVVVKPYFWVPVSLIILAGIFYQSVFKFYEETKTSIVDESVDYQLLAVKYLAEAKQLTGQLASFKNTLTQKKTRADDLLRRVARSDRYSRAEKVEAQQQVDILEEQLFIFNTLVFSEAYSLNAGSEIVVANSMITSKDFEDAVNLLTPIRNKLLVAKNSADRLEKFAALKIDVKAKKLQIDKASYIPNEEAFLVEQDALQSKLAELEAEQNIAKLVEQYYQPLAALYDQQLTAIQGSAKASNAQAFSTFQSIVDADFVSIPAGRYDMGIAKAGSVDTRPVRKVSIGALKISKYPVTNQLMRQYAALTGKLPVSRFANNRLPATNLNWTEAKAFLDWMSQQSRQSYRLPTEAEWEYVAKANKKTTYYWGNGIGRNNANCAKCGSSWDGTGASPVGQFKPNDFGVFDMSGNVWEWTQDCYVGNYRGAPSNGSAREFADCKRRVLRGGAWNSSAKEITPTFRSAALPDHKSSTIGFRIVKD
ncbi:SUMF1/EgtB/PvdOfamily nonheme iron enzyme [Aliikangiella marina]|uniref:SUMF1/EgtB/PvdOfamily nonheme iron enzyme n=1 Tax=Aliikangiella marina TaxID=1712262 RepID=A0A545TC72_9GAMM|nr:SUMF1/EgtB/PvdO family nonheme iron enzyme [Aliikangiella marina]TQV74791.1 SUMF1/EgtB/PvdOfamily nonheme iron enzyme [Aliikangiella marina]